MRPGDLHTHFYNDRHVEILDRQNGQDPAVHVRGPQAGRALRPRARRRELPVDRGGSRDAPGISSRHHQHRHPRLEHHDHAVGHAQLHVEDADARHGAEGDHLPLHRHPGARYQPFSRDRHARRGQGGRRRRPGDRGRRIRLSRRLGDEAPGDAPHRERCSRSGPARSSTTATAARLPTGAIPAAPQAFLRSNRQRSRQDRQAWSRQRTRSTTCCSRTAS